MAENHLSIPDLLENIASLSPTRKVFTFPDQSSMTIAVFYNRVELLSEFLLRNGIKKGMCVAILDDQFTNLPIIYFALAKIGVITLPLLPTLKPSELEFVLKQNKVVAIFAPPAKKEMLTNIESSHLKYFINISSFKFESLHPDSATQKIEKEIHKIKKAATELIKPDELSSPPEVNVDDELQRLILPKNDNEWKTYRYTHRHLIAATDLLTDNLNLNSNVKLFFLLPFYFNLTISLGVLAPVFKNYQVVFSKQPQNLTELKLLLKKENPTHVLAEVSFFEKLLESELEIEPDLPFWQRSKKFLDRLRKKIFNDSYKLIGQSHWLICTNFQPLSPVMRNFLLKQKINHTLLLGTYETTSVLLQGMAQNGGCWLKGNPIKGLEVKLEKDATGWGRLLVKGPNVLEEETETDWLTLPLIAKQTPEGFCLAGFENTLIELPENIKIDARLIEATLRLLPEVEEVLLLQQNKELVLKVLPNPDAFLTKPFNQLELINKISKYLDSQFPFSIEIARVQIEKHPFPKTPLGQILR